MEIRPLTDEELDRFALAERRRVVRGLLVAALLCLLGGGFGLIVAFRGNKLAWFWFAVVGVAVGVALLVIAVRSWLAEPAPAESVPRARALK